MPEWLLALLVAIVAASPGLWAIWRQRKKDESTVAEAYEAMAKRQAVEIDEQRIRLRALEDRVDCLQGYVEELEAGINLLINQLVANKMVPVWKPKVKESK